jgi:hypothetical protein
LPGRFRYDRENSDEEDDDYDDFESNNNQKSLNEHDDHQYNANSINDSLNNTKTTYQNKYETYKMKYSKQFTSNDVYEPTETNNLDDDNVSSNKSDLREYLRHKKITNSNHETSKYNENFNNNQNNFDDLDYSQPITKPINISREELIYKNSNRYQRNDINTNNNNYQKYANRNITKMNSNETVSSINEDNLSKYKDGSLSDNRDEDEEFQDDPSDEEEEDVASYKKLKSVVIVSNNKGRFIFILCIF